MTVNIHLTIHQENSNLRIDFPFDTTKDDINQVVLELVETCKLTEEESKELKDIIKKQIAQTLGSQTQITSQNTSTNSLSSIQQSNQSSQNTTSQPSQNMDFANSSGFAPIEPNQQSTFASFLNSESDDEDVRDDQEYQSLLMQQREELRLVEERHQNEQKELITRLQRGTPPNSPAACDDLIIF